MIRLFVPQLLSLLCVWSLVFLQLFLLFLLPLPHRSLLFFIISFLVVLFSLFSCYILYLFRWSSSVPDHSSFPYSGIFVIFLFSMLFSACCTLFLLISRCPSCSPSVFLPSFISFLLFV